MGDGDGDGDGESVGCIADWICSKRGEVEAFGRGNFRGNLYCSSELDCEAETVGEYLTV